MGVFPAKLMRKFTQDPAPLFICKSHNDFYTPIPILKDDWVIASSFTELTH